MRRLWRTAKVSAVPSAMAAWSTSMFCAWQRAVTAAMLSSREKERMMAGCVLAYAVMDTALPMLAMPASATKRCGR